MWKKDMLIEKLFQNLYDGNTSQQKKMLSLLTKNYKLLLILRNGKQKTIMGLFLIGVAQLKKNVVYFVATIIILL
jgi:hypothetical protein